MKAEVKTQVKSDASHVRSFASSMNRVGVVQTKRMMVAYMHSCWKIDAYNTSLASCSESSALTTAIVEPARPRYLLAHAQRGKTINDLNIEVLSHMLDPARPAALTLQ